MIRTKKKYLAVFLSILFLLSIGLGMYRDEVADVVARATIICYSCIGIK
jgi:hypothetical protein